MNKKDILSIVKKRINRDFPRFSNMPINEERIGSSAAIAKKLGIEAVPMKKKLYAFTVVNEEQFRNVLRIVIDENGKFVKISHSK